jgi:uncharacterized protein YqeY
MSIKERINADFLIAFKEKDFERKNFLGLLKSEIQNEETDAYGLLTFVGECVGETKTTKLFHPHYENTHGYSGQECKAW